MEEKWKRTSREERLWPCRAGNGRPSSEKRYLSPPNALGRDTDPVRAQQVEAVPSQCLLCLPLLLLPGSEGRVTRPRCLGTGDTARASHGPGEKGGFVRSLNTRLVPLGAAGRGQQGYGSSERSLGLLVSISRDDVPWHPCPAASASSPAPVGRPQAAAAPWWQRKGRRDLAMAGPGPRGWAGPGGARPVPASCLASPLVTWWCQVN